MLVFIRNYDIRNILLTCSLVKKSCKEVLALLGSIISFSWLCTKWLDNTYYNLGSVIPVNYTTVNLIHSKLCHICYKWTCNLCAKAFISITQPVYKILKILYVSCIIKESQNMLLKLINMHFGNQCWLKTSVHIYWSYPRGSIIIKQVIIIHGKKLLVLICIIMKLVILLLHNKKIIYLDFYNAVTLHYMSCVG